MTFLTAAIALLSLVVSSVAQANDIRAAAPALETYAQDRLFGEVGKRPGLSPRDRSVVTLAVLIASRQTVEMVLRQPGARPRRRIERKFEIITHLAFAGWANAMSAVAYKGGLCATTDRQRPTITRLADAPAAERGCRARTRDAGRTAVRRCVPGSRAVPHRRPVPRSLAAPGPRAPGSESRHHQRPERVRPGRPARLPPAPGDG